MFHRVAALCAAVLLSLTITMPAAHAEPVSLNYRGHVQNIGWQGFVNEPDTAGTTGLALRMEAFTVRGLPATVQAHVQNIGWQEPVQAGQTAGTTGLALRMEALRVRSSVAGWGIECHAYVQDIGWMPWVADGATCGTTGRALRMESVQLRLVGTNVTPTPIPSPTPSASSDVIVAVGDLGVETEGLATMARMGAERATAAVILGDLGYTPTAKPFCDAWNAAVPSPLVWVQGNHEIAPDSDGALTTDYAACLNGIGTGVEGVEQVADVGRFARIITASPQLGTSYAVGSPGYERIGAAIDKAKADGRWPILAMHEPYFTVGVHGPAGADSQALSYLARDKGVRLVLTAHDHSYGRHAADGVTYLVAGMGGHSLRPLDPASPYWPITQAAYAGTVGAGYVRLTITADRIDGTLVGSGGDSFTITR